MGVPTVSDATQKTLDSMQKQISDRLEIIKDLDEQVARLRHEQAIDQARYNHIVNQYCPISILPPEIMVNIFEAAVLSSHTKPAALIISQVSNHWRTLALSIITLWTQVRVRKGMPSPEVALLRSEHLPVHVRLDLRDFSDQECSNIAAICWKHSRRWKTVCVASDELSKLKKFMLYQIEGRDMPCPILQHVQMFIPEVKSRRTFDVEEGTSGIWENLSLNAYFSMESIRIHGPPFQFGMLPNRFRIKKLHLCGPSIRLPEMSATAVQMHLSHFVNLTHLFVNSNIPVDDWLPLAVKPIQFPSLDFLYIGSSGNWGPSDHCSYFLRSIRAPLLRFVTLDGFDVVHFEKLFTEDWRPSTGSSRLPMVTILTLRHCDCDYHSFLQMCLTFRASLTNLVIDQPVGHQPFSDLLQVLDDPTCLRNLEVLVLDIRSQYSVRGRSAHDIEGYQRIRDVAVNQAAKAVPLQNLYLSPFLIHSLSLYGVWDDINKAVDVRDVFEDSPQELLDEDAYYDSDPDDW